VTYCKTIKRSQIKEMRRLEHRAQNNTNKKVRNWRKIVRWAVISQAREKEQPALAQSSLQPT